MSIDRVVAFPTARRRAVVVLRRVVEAGNLPWGLLVVLVAVFVVLMALLAATIFSLQLFTSLFAGNDKRKRRPNERG